MSVTHTEHLEAGLAILRGNISIALAGSAVVAMNLKLSIIAPLILSDL